MIINKTITLQTKGHGDTIDITAHVTRVLAASEVNNGSITIFVTGSTAGVTTMEYEPNLVEDFSKMWEEIAPGAGEYRRDKTWGDKNGYAHVRASLLGASLVVPFKAKALLLGTWQQIVVVDFDNRPRERQVAVQVMGE
jgi:secondary thiamine-phosphate synthase enzyme